MCNRKLQVAACLAMLLAAAPWASAATVTFDMAIEFSGATPPSGAAPWMRATFDDGGGMGSVTLTLTSLTLSGSEFVGQWLFNLDPALDPTLLTFTGGAVSSGAFTLPTTSVGVNAFMADGDGKFDIKFDFDNTDGASKKFGNTDVYTVTIEGIASLTASSFNFLSFPSGGHGPFPTAAHVQGIGATGDDSGWVTVVPLPAAAWMGMALMGSIGGVGLIRHRRRQVV